MTATIHQIDHRQHQRFRLQPMYTSVVVQRVRGLRVDREEGHAYDISESGVRLELDSALDPGEVVALQVTLPGQIEPILVNGSVVWVHSDEDDPAARRLAVRFTDFTTDEDHQRLISFLGHGAHRQAA